MRAELEQVTGIVEIETPRKNKTPDKYKGQAVCPEWMAEQFLQNELDYVKQWPRKRVREISKGWRV